MASSCHGSEQNNRLGQRAGMAPEGTSPCGPRAAGDACRLWRLFSARLLVVNAEGRLLRGRGKAALGAFVHARHQHVVAEAFPALLRVVNGDDVQPSADGPAAWKICPSGRLPSLGCTAANFSSVCARCGALYGAFRLKTSSGWPSTAACGNYCTQAWLAPNSPELRAGDRGPQEGEVRVDGERPPEPRPRRRRAEAALDHCAVEDEERVARSEADRASGVPSCFLAAAVAVEAPGQRVFRVDARRGLVCRARPREGVDDIPVVVEVEDGGLELGADAVRGEELLDRAHKRVLATCRDFVAGDVEDVPEPDHVGRDREHVDCSAKARDRLAIVTLGGLDACETGLGVHVAGKATERPPVGLRGCPEPTHVEVDVADLRDRPRDLLRYRRVCFERQLVSGDGRGGAADELARVRHAAERGNARRLEGHSVVHVERLRITPEVEEGIAERTVGGTVLGIEAKRLPREAEPVPEPVPGVGERRLALDDQG